jgi:beta-lactamase regulating signal transducer with metallopeptidase domain
MSFATSWLPESLQPAAWAVGWVLVHFVWQATVVAALVLVALSWSRRSSATVRHGVCCVGLAAMAALPVVTLLLIGWGDVPEVSVPFLMTVRLGDGLRVWVVSLVPWLSVAWMAGVVVMQLRLAWQIRCARRLRHTGLCELPDRWQTAVAQIARRVGLRHAVQAYESALAQVPMVVGWLRPVVLVPSSALTGLSPQQLRAVLAHELAHIRRRDALVNLLQGLIESLFFFHPAVWWLSNRLRVEREYCCDDVAVATCGDTLTYARALAALDTLRADVPRPALAATGGSLMDRLSRLLDVTPSRRRFGAGLAPLMLTLVLAAAVSAMGLAGDETDPGGANAGLYGVDLVEVVRAVDPDQGHMLELMRAVGVEDGALLAFLSDAATRPEVLDAIRAATNRATALRAVEAFKQDMHHKHMAIKNDVAEGLITKQEAEFRVQDLKRSGQDWHAANAGLLAAIREDKTADELKAADHDKLLPKGRVHLLESAEGALVAEAGHLLELKTKLHAIETRQHVAKWRLHREQIAEASAEGLVLEVPLHQSAGAAAERDAWVEIEVEPVEVVEVRLEGLEPVEPHAAHVTRTHAFRGRLEQAAAEGLMTEGQLQLVLEMSRVQFPVVHLAEIEALGLVRQQYLTVVEVQAAAEAKQVAEQAAKHEAAQKAKDKAKKEELKSLRALGYVD